MPSSGCAPLPGGSKRHAKQRYPAGGALECRSSMHWWPTRLTAYGAALDNDLNTAEARAAVFDVVRAANIALDNGSFGTRQHRTHRCTSCCRRLRRCLRHPDRPRCGHRPARVPWRGPASRRPHGRGIAPETCWWRRASPSEEAIEALIAGTYRRPQAPQLCRRGDAIRNELAEKGVLLEDGKAGVTWKRK